MQENNFQSDRTMTQKQQKKRPLFFLLVALSLFVGVVLCDGPQSEVDAKGKLQHNHHHQKRSYSSLSSFPSLSSSSLSSSSSSSSLSSNDESLNKRFNEKRFANREILLNDHDLDSDLVAGAAAAAASQLTKKSKAKIYDNSIHHVITAKKRQMSQSQSDFDEFWAHLKNTKQQQQHHQNSNRNAADQQRQRQEVKQYDQSQFDQLRKLEQMHRVKEERRQQEREQLEQADGEFEMYKNDILEDDIRNNNNNNFEDDYDNEYIDYLFSGFPFSFKDWLIKSNTNNNNVNNNYNRNNQKQQLYENVMRPNEIGNSLGNNNNNFLFPVRPRFHSPSKNTVANGNTGDSSLRNLLELMKLKNYNSAHQSSASGTLHRPSMIQASRLTHNSANTNINAKIDQIRQQNDYLFIFVVAGCTLAGAIVLMAAGVCWYSMYNNNNNNKNNNNGSKRSDSGMKKGVGTKVARVGGVQGMVEKGDNFDKKSSIKSNISTSSGDRRLAQSAQMYHYQHQKQQMIAMEKANTEAKNDNSDNSDGELEEGDYTVYECPGLAPTGEMEVKNPLFKDDFAATPTTPATATPALATAAPPSYEASKTTSEKKKDGEVASNNNTEKTAPTITTTKD